MARGRRSNPRVSDRRRETWAAYQRKARASDPKHAFDKQTRYYQRHAKAAIGGDRPEWTEKEIQLALALRRDGVPLVQIGMVLNRSYMAVAHYFRRYLRGIL